MKKLLGIALMMAVVAGGFTVNAQTPVTVKKDATEQQCNPVRQQMGPKKDKKEKMGRKDFKQFKGDKDGVIKPQQKGQRPDPFEGIELSAEQKAQLDALKAEHKPQRGKGNGGREKVSREDREAHRAEYTAKVKEILTPEQWTIYEQNVEKMKTERPRRDHR